MLFALSALIGRTVDTRNGHAGTVKDFLFEDNSWRVRWMVLDTGEWLPGRKVLIHPSAIAPLQIASPSANSLPLMGTRPDLRLSLSLTAEQIAASPDIHEDEPVSRRMEQLVSGYYGWDPYWGPTFFGTNAIASGVLAPGYVLEPTPADLQASRTPSDDGDAHLRSLETVTGYHIHATDGPIGHVEQFFADDDRWDIRYLAVDTRNWWPGRHVLLSPFAVRGIDWAQRRIDVNATRALIESSPKWDPLAMIERNNEAQLHRHYGWPGYSGS